MRYLVIALALSGLLIGTTGCGEPSEELKNVGEKLGDTWSAVKKYTVKKRGEFEEFAGKGLETIKDKWKVAREKGAEISDDAAASMEGEWKVVQEKWDALQGASADEWDKAKDAFVNAYEAAKGKFEDLTK